MWRCQCRCAWPPVFRYMLVVPQGLVLVFFCTRRGWAVPAGKELLCHSKQLSK